MVFVCFRAAMAGIMSVVSIPSTSTHMATEVTAARRVPGIRWDASHASLLSRVLALGLKYYHLAGKHVTST